MSKTGSWANNSYKFQSFLEWFRPYRSCSGLNYPACSHRFQVAKPGHGYSMHRGLQLISSNGPIWRKQQNTNIPSAGPSPPPLSPLSPPPPLPRFNFFLWARWVLGSLLCLFLPFWKQKWNQLLNIEGEAEMVVEEVEKVAEVVEKVALEAEKLLEDVADNLPDNHPKLKNTALFVEGLSKATAHDAQITLNLMHKVDEVKDDLDDLEKMVEPIVDKIVHQKSQGK